MSPHDLQAFESVPLTTIFGLSNVAASRVYVNWLSGPSTGDFKRQLVEIAMSRSFALVP